MDSVTVQANAKINLALDVLSKREDGYHDMRMVMQSVSLHDTLTLQFTGEGLQVKTAARYLPSDDRNLAAKAARLYWKKSGVPEEPLTILLEKRIPVCAGTAGGSSDAAAVLRALNHRYGEPLSENALSAVGEAVGSDVPFCLLGGTALAEGKGERLTPLPALPECVIVLCKPDFSVSTPELFARIQCSKIRKRPDIDGLIAGLERKSLPEAARRMYNVFEDSMGERSAAVVRELKSTMIQSGALGAVMTGTGPTVFGLFEKKEDAEGAYRVLKERYPDTFLTHPV